MNRSLLSGLAIAIICAAPLGAVLFLAVTGSSTGYLNHIAATRLPSYISNTILVGGISILSAGFTGTLAAWLVSRYSFVGRSFMEWALALPLAVPAYAAAYAWYDLTQAAGPLGSVLPTVRGVWGAGIIFGMTLYPYVYLLAREAFSGQSRDAFDAARTLGASPVTAFLKTSLPMARPAIAAGLALVLMETLADYGAVIHLGAPTLSVAIIRAWAGEGSVVDAARLAIMLVGLALLVFSLERAQRRRARQSPSSGRTRPADRVVLTGPRSILVLSALCLPIMAGLLIPIARLAWRAASSPDSEATLGIAMNSLQLALIAGALAAGLGVLAAYAIRYGGRVSRLSVRIAGLGYAVPGAVAAVGVLGLFGALQSFLDQMWAPFSDIGFPIVLSGGIAGLIFAYLSRFAAAAIGPSETALARVSPTLDGASRTLGVKGFKLFMQVHWPLILPGVVLSGLLVFVEVLKELPATMILRPFNYDTLAVVAHNYASDERLGEAALPALSIILLATGPMIWIARQITRRQINRAGDPE